MYEDYRDLAVVLAICAASLIGGWYGMGLILASQY